MEKSCAVFLVVFLAVSCNYAYASIARPQWFTQQLDHFDPQNFQTWQQRYFVNDTFWNKELSGPIFVQIGGEGAINPGYVTEDWMMGRYGRGHNALLVALEHRFYGQSQPFKNSTEPLATENLVYLSIDQALADLANFIQSFKQFYPGAENSSVITFGCSYSGALAAWYRQKYPFTTVGSVASSAPVLAVLDFFEYLDVVDQSLSTFSGPSCDARISNATQQIENLLNTTSGQNQVQQLFKTCTVPQDPLDIATLMSDLMGNWMGTVQYNDENGNPITIDYLCNIMENTTAYPNALDAYVQVNDIFLKQQNAACLDISYNDMIQELKNTSYDPFGVGDRQWTYQTCVEVGYYQSTDSGPSVQPFGSLVPLSYYLQICNDTFGAEIAQYNGLRVNQTNFSYGGKGYSGSSNVVFENGSIDPWHSLSIINDVSPTVTAQLVVGTAHCATVEPPTSLSPPGLVQCQKETMTKIGRWLEKGNL